MEKSYRYYQKEADDAIYSELLVNNKCIVKMFCGTGKSLLMRYCTVAQSKNLVVYVVPSLPLLEQFYDEYFVKKMDFPLENILKVSSDKESTTEKKEIVRFLKKKKQKIVCVLYQSLGTFLSALGNTKINVCIFDEAHHAGANTYSSFIFDTDVYEKQIFFTATPKNTNGVIMFDKDNEDASKCGKLVYDYSYFKGVMEGYLNPFEIRLDFYTENTKGSVYESIARAILASGNNRCLTFHADVNAERDTSVLRFVNESDFELAFNNVINTEYPDKIGCYKRVQMICLHSNVVQEERKRILNHFDTTPDNEVFIISSCQTIGEGIDTKNANMCVFVDPKSSYVSITQNIGRIVRKNPDVIKPNSTILIPCWVDKEKYLDCNGDRDKCDEVIREDMNKQGNFNGILNVMSALKQEDEDLFEACLHYPTIYSPQEIEGNLSKYGYKLEEPIGDGSLVENLEHLLETEVELDEDNEETDEEMLARVAEENNVVIEVHSDSLETPIEYYGLQEGEEVVRIFKSYDDELEETVYQPIVKKDGAKRNADTVEPLRRENRFNVKVHTNPDVKVLWNLSSELDLSKGICSCVIDSEVVDMWPQRFEELKAFIDENKRRPSQIDKTNNIAMLGIWLSKQTQNYKYKKNNMKNRLRYDLWEQFLKDYKEYFVSDDEVWFKRFEELKLFIDVNKERPNTCSKNLNEKQLGGWLSTQIKEYKNKYSGMKDHTRYNLWTQFLEDYKEYFVSGDELWFQRFEELKIFIDDNKTRPYPNSKNPEEKQLGSWLCNQLHYYKNQIHGMNDGDRYNLWTQFLENYNEYFVTIDELWLKNIDNCKSFIQINKKIPNQTAKNVDEKYLGHWLSNQQKDYKQKAHRMKDQSRYNEWVQFVEKYKEYFVPDEEIWLKNLDSCKSFIQINKKIPCPTAKNVDEKYLGRWKSTQQKDYKKKAHGMKDNSRYNLWSQFLEEYKEYFVPDEEIWFQNFEELKTFIDSNKRTPLKRANNPEEKQLGTWLAAQKQKYKNKIDGMKDKKRYNLWSQFLEDYKEYFVTIDEIWFQRFEELKTFIDANNRKPTHSTSPQEKLLCQWLSHQVTNYKNKKHSMKDESKYNLWTQFLEEHKEYFNGSISETSSTNSEEQEQPEQEVIKILPKKKSAKLYITKAKEEKIETKESVRNRTQPLITQYHNKFCKMRSDTLAKHFKENPNDFHEYHRVRDENFKTYDYQEIPCNRIIMELEKINTTEPKKVVDMGCGTAKISEHFKGDPRFQFTNYDHVAINDTVQVCDISEMPLNDNSVDICIMSLALWGPNRADYIKEAQRVLASQGSLYIIDSTKRWTETDEVGNMVKTKLGKQLMDKIEDAGFVILRYHVDECDKFCSFKCYKE
jgi:superfamily II DNA or RNA helicase